MRILTQSDLDQMVGAGCTDPLCPLPHPHPLEGAGRLIPQCHPDAMLRLFLADGEVELFCNACRKPAALLPSDKVNLRCLTVWDWWQQSCHPAAGLLAIYRQGSGLVDVWCPDCRQKLGSIGI